MCARHAHIVYVFALAALTGCASSQAEPNSAAHETGTSTDAPAQPETSFARSLCDGPQCRIVDVQDPAVDYGAWLADALELAALREARVIDVTHVEVGPNRASEYFNVGRVRYLAPGAEQVQAIVAGLDAVEGGAFSAGKVAMRAVAIFDGLRVEIWFSDSFHPAVDRWFDSLRRQRHD